MTVGVDSVITTTMIIFHSRWRFVGLIKKVAHVSINPTGFMGKDMILIFIVEFSFFLYNLGADFCFNYK